MSFSVLFWHSHALVLPHFNFHDHAPQSSGDHSQLLYVFSLRERQADIHARKQGKTKTFIFCCLILRFLSDILFAVKKQLASDVKRSYKPLYFEQPLTKQSVTITCNHQASMVFHHEAQFTVMLMLSFLLTTRWQCYGERCSLHSLQKAKSQWWALTRYPSEEAWKEGILDHFPFEKKNNEKRVQNGVTLLVDMYRTRSFKPVNVTMQQMPSQRSWKRELCAWNWNCHENDSST